MNKGRSRKGFSREEHFTKIIRSTMEEPAWRALSSAAQSLYPWLKLEWRGPENNNNGKIQLSVRQAAERMGVGINTANRAFHDLQAKGFLVIREKGTLGVTGAAKTAAYELTELKMPGSEHISGEKKYRHWTKGHDFEVDKSAINNPVGRNGKTESHHQNEDSNVIKMVTKPDSLSSK